MVVDDIDEQTGYSERHGVESASVLTICDDQMAADIAALLAPRITDRTVVEIGGGIGLLAFHLAAHAKRVYCFEANPLWSSSFVKFLYRAKPKNVSYVFGASSEFAGQIYADVAVFATHSGVDSMKRAGLLFAPDVIDIYGEIIAANPGRFDPLARLLRPLV